VLVTLRPTTNNRRTVYMRFNCFYHSLPVATLVVARSLVGCFFVWQDHRTRVTKQKHRRERRRIRAVWVSIFSYINTSVEYSSMCRAVKSRVAGHFSLFDMQILATMMPSEQRMCCKPRQALRRLCDSLCQQKTRRTMHSTTHSRLRRLCDSLMCQQKTRRNL